MHKQNIHPSTLTLLSIYWGTCCAWRAREIERGERAVVETEREEREKKDKRERERDLL